MRNLFLILTLALALASAEPTNDKGDTVPEEVIEEVKASEDKPADNDDDLRGIVRVARFSNYDYDKDTFDQSHTKTTSSVWWYKGSGDTYVQRGKVTHLYAYSFFPSFRSNLNILYYG